MEYDYRRGSVLDIGFIYHFYTKIRTAITAPSLAQHFTSHYSKQTSALSLLLTSGSGNNSGYFSASVFKSSLNGSSLPNASSCFNCPPYNPFARTEWKTQFQQYQYCCMRIRYRGNMFTEPLPRNGSTRHNIFRKPE
jgi:hypothetical protein